MRWSVRLVLTVTAAVVRTGGGWIEKPRDPEQVERYRGQGRWTTDIVHGILTGVQPVPDWRKKDERTAQAAQEWLLSMDPSALWESDRFIRDTLETALRLGVSDDSLGRVATVIPLYSHREKYTRRDNWRKFAEHSTYQGIPKQRIGPLRVTVTDVREDPVPYYTGSCTCSTPHGHLSKQQGKCPTVTKKYRQGFIYVFTDERGNMYKHEYHPKGPRILAWSKGDSATIRATVKKHELINVRGGASVQCTVIKNVKEVE